MSATTWNMLFAPAGTPRSVIDRLNKVSNQILAQPAFVKQLAELATEAVSDSTPESARAFLLEEMNAWAQVVKLAGIKPDE